jgi:protein-S-isoprenylcysteine O-methyltransferase Ste14
LNFQRRFLLIPVILGLLAYATWQICSERPWAWMQTLGLCLAVPAAALLVTAHVQLGASFAIRAEARKLVTRGLYARIRNPIYVFSAVLFAGLALLWNRPKLFVLFAALIPLQVIRARKEARVLEEKFGEEYRQYRAKTWF